MRRDIVLGISTGIESTAVALNLNGDLLHYKILNHSSDQKRVAEIAEYLRPLKDKSLIVMLEHDHIRDPMKAQCRKNIYNLGKFQGLLAGLGMNHLSFLSRPRWKFWIEVHNVRGKMTADQKAVKAVHRKFDGIDLSENRDGGETHKGFLQAYCAARMGLWLALSENTTEHRICVERMDGTDFSWPPT